MKVKSIKNPWQDMAIPPSGKVTKRRISKKFQHDTFWGVSDKGHFIFMFMLQKKPKPRSLNIKLNGIEAFWMSYPDSDALILSLKENADWPLFYKVCIDLCEVSSGYKDESKAATAAIERLAYWQDFLKNKRLKGLSLEEQIGLIGELLFLKRCLLPHFPPEDAVNAWAGPNGHLRDFSLGGLQIEVKARLDSSRNSATISSAEQLEVEIGELYLAAVSIAPSIKDLNSFSLDGLSSEIFSGLKKRSIHASILFKEKLESLGAFMDGSYSEAYYSFISLVLYEVNDKFPKIVSSNLAKEITQVKYEINLNKCSKFKRSLPAILRKG